MVHNGPIGEEYETDQPRWAKTARLVAPAGLDRDAWLSVRRRGIGGSDVSALVGLNKYRSPYSLWLEKTGQFVADDEQSEAAELGVLLEPTVASIFEHRTGHKVFPTPGTLANRELPWMMVNLDFLVCDEEHKHVECKPGSFLECKTTAGVAASDWTEDELPYAAALQVHHGLMVTGYNHGYVAGLVGSFGGHKFVTQRVERDEKLNEQLIRQETEFMRRIAEMDPPPMDGSDATTDVLKVMYAESEAGKEVELPDLALDVIEARELAREEAKAAKERQAECDNVLKSWLKEAEVGQLAGRTVVTWKRSEVAAYVVPARSQRTINIKKVKTSK